MPVPDDDLVCYFIRPGEGRWVERENRPHPKAFRARDYSISVWHIERLAYLNVYPADLRFSSLKGSGQVHHTAGDYRKLAGQVAAKFVDGFSVEVEWRSDDTHVNPEWRPWADAHAQVESKNGESTFPPKYRELLALNCRYKVPPTGN